MAKIIKPDPNRIITFAAPTGQLLQMSIIEFVVFVTWLVEDTADPEVISERTGHTAEVLCEYGWFTHDEFVEAWTISEMEDVDEEFVELMEEEWGHESES